jgi:hypothetical protein
MTARDYRKATAKPNIGLKKQQTKGIFEQEIG